jgi:hypothetical protein
MTDISLKDLQSGGKLKLKIIRPACLCILKRRFASEEYTQAR